MYQYLGQIYGSYKISLIILKERDRYPVLTLKMSFKIVAESILKQLFFSKKIRVNLFIRIICLADDSYEIVRKNTYIGMLCAAVLTSSYIYNDFCI